MWKSSFVGQIDILPAAGCREIPPPLFIAAPPEISRQLATWKIKWKLPTNEISIVKMYIELYDYLSFMWKFSFVGENHILPAAGCREIPPPLFIAKSFGNETKNQSSDSLRVCVTWVK